MTELKPCPFCGGDNVSFADWPSDDWDNIWEVECNECMTHFTFAVPKGKTVYDVWNTRKGEPKKCCGNCKYSIYRGVYEQYGENIGFCYCDWKEKMINPLLSTPYDPMDGDNCEYWVSYDCKEGE